MSTKSLMRSNERFFVLLCLIVGLLVLVPILNRFVAARVFLDIFLTAVVISMVYVVSHKKWHVIAGVLLTIVTLASLWLQYSNPNKAIAAIGTRCIMNAPPADIPEQTIRATMRIKGSDELPNIWGKAAHGDADIIAKIVVRRIAFEETRDIFT